MNKTFSCSACGGTNKPQTGTSRMACAYCGANLNIPAHLQSAATPSVEEKLQEAKTSLSLENEAVNVLRQAQPIAARAWNAFIFWNWLRWLLPACLTLIALGCVALTLNFSFIWFNSIV
ncbi:MAG: hypothetical protein HXY38_14325 [Chloroflexi bacterium]|nr:hypothetical protein [Chloroflexota bacterium]